MYQLTCNTLHPIVWKNSTDCLFRIKDSSVWKFRINELIPSVDHLFSLLHQEEKNKASLFKFEKDKKAYPSLKEQIIDKITMTLHVTPDDVVLVPQRTF